MYEFERIEKLKKDIEKNNNPKDMIELGEIYDSFNNEFLAEKYFKMASEYNSLEGLFKLGNFYLDNNRLNSAENCFKELADKGNNEFQNSLAKVYRRQLKYDLAEKYYKLSMESGNQKAVFNLGYMYFLIKKYDLAIEILKELSDDPRACLTLGKIYHIKDDFENCEKYLKLTGSHSTAYLVLGKLYKEKEMFDLAEKYFKLCADEKDDKEAQRELCQLYHHQKNFALEEKYLKLIINNGDLKSFVILAEKYTEEKRYEEALELYKKIEDKNLNSICNCPFEESIIMCNLGKCYLKLNKFEEAEKYLKYVDEVDSFDCYLEVADIFYKAGMKEKAEKYYLSAFKEVKYREYEDSKKKKAKISYCLGEIYLNANKLSSAEEYLKIAVENKYGAEAIQLLATVYEKQSNLGLAKKYYSEANTEEAKSRLSVIKQKENLIKNL